MTRPPDQVDVFADLDHFEQPRPMGSLRRQIGRQSKTRGELFSFEYDQSWLATSNAFTFDPDLALVQGPQYPPSDRANFGIFLDSAPDRWGRVLMQRRENILARRESRAARSLSDWDFLLGVHDETRLGALRLQDPSNASWLDSSNPLAAPPITSLRKLQSARSARCGRLGTGSSSIGGKGWNQRPSGTRHPGAGQRLHNIRRKAV